MRTAADDAVLRLALALWIADKRATIPGRLHVWIIHRLEGDLKGTATPFTDDERALVREPLLAFLGTYHPRILAIVTQQFTADGGGEGPQGTTHPKRPSQHYGVVSERPQA
jgi:hypothetical protein